MSDDEPTIVTETDGGVFTIRLSRPRKKNAFNLRMLRELAEAFTAYEQAAELRCALLVAAGDAFTAGLDLAEVGPAVAQGEPLFPKGSVDPLDLFEPRRRKPLVCAVHGYCFTIGIELLLACDVALAATTTQLAQMEVQRGIMPFGGATLRFARICGYSNAMRWLLTGERFGAAEALRIGLVQEVCEPDELVERAAAVAATIAAQAPLAVQATRAASLLALEQGTAPALAALLGEARALMGTDDAKEGVRSFLERRAASFKGR